RGAAEALRAECAPDGVRVSIAYPPDVDTPQLAAERPLRAPETAALAGTAGTMSAAAAAAAILRGARSGRFDVPLGLTAWAMLRLMPLARPWVDLWADGVVRRARRRPGGDGDAGAGAGGEGDGGED
ncbi:MAG: hypothetical protein AAFU61_08245, partial [Pseudomonadota bacterium]